MHVIIIILFLSLIFSLKSFFNDAIYSLQTQLKEQKLYFVKNKKIKGSWLQKGRVLTQITTKKKHRFEGFRKISSHHNFDIYGNLNQLLRKVKYVVSLY